MLCSVSLCVSCHSDPSFQRSVLRCLPTPGFSLSRASTLTTNDAKYLLGIPGGAYVPATCTSCSAAYWSCCGLLTKPGWAKWSEMLLCAAGNATNTTAQAECVSSQTGILTLFGATMSMTLGVTITTPTALQSAVRVLAAKKYQHASARVAYSARCPCAQRSSLAMSAGHRV